jgi:hypothetical protein
MLKWLKKVALLLVFLFGASLTYRLLPIIREKDTYLSLLDQKLFAKKALQPLPDWAETQIHEDLKLFKEKKISLKALDTTFEMVNKKAEGHTSLLRYRILNNKLYKFIPSKVKYSDGNDPIEKALRTLTLLTDLPNIDFIICPMDGIPEPYMPVDFTLADDPENQAPILGKAKIQGAATNHVVLIPDQFSLSDDWYGTIQEILKANPHFSWNAKKGGAFWRGTLTDMGTPNEKFTENYRLSPRFLISQMSKQAPDLVDAGIVYFGKIYEKSLLKEEVVKEGASKRHHLLYKYLPVLDGHMCTYPGFQWRLLSNSVTLKQTSNQIQWFYSALKPFEHYIPIKNDISDLVEKIEWAKNHEERVLKVIDNAQNFALQNLMMEDNYLYLAAVLKKYASLQDSFLKEPQKDRRFVCIQYPKQFKFLHFLSKKWERL